MWQTSTNERKQVIICMCNDRPFQLVCQSGLGRKTTVFFSRVIEDVLGGQGRKIVKNKRMRRLL